MALTSKNLSADFSNLAVNFGTENVTNSAPKILGFIIRNTSDPGNIT